MTLTWKKDSGGFCSVSNARASLKQKLHQEWIMTQVITALCWTDGCTQPELKPVNGAYSQCGVSAYLCWHMTKLKHRERPYLLRSSSASDRGGAGSSEGGAELRDHRTEEGWIQIGNRTNQEWMDRAEMGDEKAIHPTQGRATVWLRLVKRNMREEERRIKR